jgi:nucleoid-associated protein YgaU
VAVAKSADQAAAAGRSARDDGRLVKAPVAPRASGVAPVASVDAVAGPSVAVVSEEPLGSDSRNDRQPHLAAAPESEELVAESVRLRAEDDSSAFRSVRVAAGSTLSSLTREVYGLVDPGLIARVQSANPHVVNPDHILAGDTLRFPQVDQRTGQHEDHQ